MKLLASDYDDTFYINDSDIKNNVKLVQEFMNENLFIIATGRSYDDFKKAQEKYNIKYNYLIINHGSTIIKNDEIIYNIYIDNEFKNKLVEVLNLDNNYFACSEKLSRVDITCDNITKINIKYGAKAKEINNFLNLNYSKYIKSILISEGTIEIIANNVGKEVALKYLIESLNINKDDVYTIGDGYSDIKMIENYNGYCMKHSAFELSNLTATKLNSVSELINLIKSSI